MGKYGITPTKTIQKETTIGEIPDHNAKKKSQQLMTFEERQQDIHHKTSNGLVIKTHPKYNHPQNQFRDQIISSLKKFLLTESPWYGESIEALQKRGQVCSPMSWCFTPMDAKTQPTVSQYPHV